MVADNGGLQAVAAGTENAYKHEKTCVVAVVFLFRELCKSEEIPYDISPLQPQCVKRSCSGMPRWLLQPKLLLRWLRRQLRRPMSAGTRAVSYTYGWQVNAPIRLFEDAVDVLAEAIAIAFSFQTSLVVPDDELLLLETTAEVLLDSPHQVAIPSISGLHLAENDVVLLDLPAIDRSEDTHLVREHEGCQ